MALTEKQKIFADEYLVDLNATRAYKVAYPKVKADSTAASNGSRMLRNDKVAEYIQQRQRERSERTQITQDWVLQELYKIASANGTDYARVVEVTAKNEDGDDLLDSNGDPIMVDTVKIVPTEQLTADQRAAVSTIKNTRYGVSVETHDKVKALELIGRHLGMFKERPEEVEDTGCGVVFLAPVLAVKEDPDE